jgi:hypothetical protein
MADFLSDTPASDALWFLGRTEELFLLALGRFFSRITQKTILTVNNYLIVLPIYFGISSLRLTDF